MNTQMHLQALNLNWIDDTQDNPRDLCAHGHIEFSVGGQKLTSVEDGEFTLSAAAINLLRTIEKDHTPELPLFEFLFPCCGLPMGVESNGDAYLAGCNGGMDFHIQSQDQKVCIQDQINNEFIVSASEWQNAVLSFSKSVGDFYTRSSPKLVSDEFETEAFDAFCDEWRRRDPDIETSNFRSLV